MDDLSALRGQIQDSYILRFEASEDETLYWLDCNQAFPAMAILHEIATGGYSTHYVGEEEQDHITFEGNDFCFRGTRMLGVALVRVYAPQTLNIPILSYKVAGQNIALLCLRCALDASKGKPYKLCRHKEKGRSFISTYSTCEIVYAAKLGYRFHFYELALFHTSEKLLEKFITALIFDKMRYCDFPADCTREAYLESLNSSLRFEELLGGQKLTMENVKPNKHLKELHKLALNGFLGFFSLSLEDATESKFLSEYDDLARAVNTRQVKSIDDFNNAVLITTALNKNKRRELKQNVMVGIMITSLARVHIHTQTMKLIAQGAQIFRINCDSIVFSLCNKTPMDLDTSSYLIGSFKHEYRNIKSLAQLGMNTMSLMYTNAAGKDETIFKTCGIQQTAEVAARLTHQKFVDMVDESIKRHTADEKPKKDASMQVPNVRTFAQKLTSVKVRNDCQIQMNSALKRRQLVEANYPYVTRPFGYRSDGIPYKNPFIKKH